MGLPGGVRLAGGVRHPGAVRDGGCRQLHFDTPSVSRVSGEDNFSTLPIIAIDIFRPRAVVLGI